MPQTKNTNTPNLSSILLRFGIDASQVADLLTERLNVISEIDSLMGTIVGYPETRKLLAHLKSVHAKSDCRSFEWADIDILIEYHSIDPASLKAELLLLIDGSQWDLAEQNEEAPFETLQVYYKSKIAANQIHRLCLALDWPRKLKINLL